MRPVKKTKCEYKPRPFGTPKGRGYSVFEITARGKTSPVLFFIEKPLTTKEKGGKMKLRNLV